MISLFRNSWFWIIVSLAVLGVSVFLLQKPNVEAVQQFQSNSITHITLSHTPARIEEETTVNITVATGYRITGAWIEGVNMYMGKIPVMLTDTSELSYSGVFFLGACSEPIMQWRMMISVEDGEGQTEVNHYLFASDITAGSAGN